MLTPVVWEEPEMTSSASTHWYCKGTKRCWQIIQSAASQSGNENGSVGGEGGGELARLARLSLVRGLPAAPSSSRT